MPKKIITICIIILYFAVIFFSAGNVRAGLYENTNSFSESAGFGELSSIKSPAMIIAEIIQWFLFLLGIIFVILIIYSGYLWLVAGGNSEQVDAAKKRIISAIIGLIIILAAYAITYFVLEKFIEAAAGRLQTG